MMMKLYRIGRRTASVKIPLGNAGKSFVTELISRLYNAVPLLRVVESIALMAATDGSTNFTPTKSSQMIQNKGARCLSREAYEELAMWPPPPVKEGRSLQQRLPKLHSGRSDHQISRSFANLMFKGRHMLLLTFTLTMVKAVCSTLMTRLQIPHLAIPL